MSKIKLATAWLDGCSGCHMSILDTDERLIELAAKIEVVCSPYVDLKEFPEGVDVTLVEGAVGNEEDLKKIRKIRQRTRCLVALGDCAVTGNVSAMRNPFGVEAVLNRAYVETASHQPQTPCEDLPALLPQARPLHEIVEVDVFIPGCPPSADFIYYVLSELLEGRKPDLSTRLKFG
jgi:NAD-reducing hydrogenase small subunit